MAERFVAAIMCALHMIADTVVTCIIVAVAIITSRRMVAVLTVAAMMTVLMPMIVIIAMIAVMLVPMKQRRSGRIVHGEHVQPQRHG